MHVAHADSCSGQSYLVYISSETAITDQIPEGKFSIIAASIEISTAGSQMITEGTTINRLLFST